MKPQHLAVLGSPITHSRSPRIHRAAYRVLGLDWQYDAIECTPERLEELLDSRDIAWRGFSVTMPLKDQAFKLSSVRDPVAEASGVVNTLMRITGQGLKPAWAGFNTDVSGLAEAVRESQLDASRTVVLGAGATAVSAVLAAQQLGAQQISVVARRLEQAAALASRFGVNAYRLDSPEMNDLFSAPAGSEATLVISTLPGPAGAAIGIADGFTRVPLFDVAYDPWPSPLAARWRAAGGEAHSGISMLVHQALAQLRIFVGGDPSFVLENEGEVLAAMRAAGSEGIEIGAE